MSDSTNVRLPDSIAGGVESAQVRDLSGLVKRTRKWRNGAMFSFILAIVFISLIPMPVGMISLTAKIPLPVIALLFLISAVMMWQMHLRYYRYIPDQGKAIAKIKQHIPKPDEILLGYDMDTGEPHTITLKEMTNHMSVCSSSGGGKTTFNNTMVYQLLKRGCPVIYFNGKRSDDNANRATYLAEAADCLHKLRLIDPLSDVGHHINPCASTRQVGKIANKVLNLLPAESAEGGAAHYRQQTYRYIVQLVEILLATNKTFNYADILAFISHTSIAVSVLQEELKSKGKKSALNRLAGMFLNLDDKAKKDAIFRKMREDMAGLEAQLQALVTLESGKFITSNSPTVTFKDSINKGHFLFVELPVLQDKEQSEMLANVLFLELTEAIGEIYNNDGKSLTKPCVVILEEVSAYSQAILSLLLMQAREANFAFQIYLQTPTSLKKKERGLTPEFMEEMMGNCSLQYWMNINGVEGQEWASKSFGKIIRHFASVSRGEMSGESSKRLGSERFINPNRDVRSTETSGWSEQLDDMVHASMFKDLKTWESLIYKDGRLRRIMMEHTFITPPDDYDFRTRIPALPHHGARAALNLSGRVDARLQDHINESIQNEHTMSAHAKDSSKGFPVKAADGDADDPWV